jgi:uncharacterized membrane protein YhfC
MQSDVFDKLSSISAIGWAKKKGLLSLADQFLGNIACFVFVKKILLTFWHRNFFNFLAHPVYKM